LQVDSVVVNAVDGGEGVLDEAVAANGAEEVRATAKQETCSDLDK
jgi:hypothetical protein